MDYAEIDAEAYAGTLAVVFILEYKFGSDTRDGA